MSDMVKGSGAVGSHTYRCLPRGPWISQLPHGVSPTHAKGPARASCTEGSARPVSPGARRARGQFSGRPVTRAAEAQGKLERVETRRSTPFSGRPTATAATAWWLALLVPSVNYAVLEVVALMRLLLSRR